ncbi:MAG: zinc-binding dehydrogenase [Streptosporangiales bacterium]|nr:zinc-binding dehydrogenase [Streptosporangiales bacterium]
MSTAVVFDEYGDPDVLHLADVELPEVAPDQVLVDVAAAGVQPFDTYFRSGRTASWLPATFPQQLGNEVAGTVREVGADVTAFAAGGEVLGWVSFRGYAEQVVVKAKQLVAKPVEMPFEVAGVLTASGQTAATALEDLAVTAGDTFLVHAAAGGVGSFAVQLARAAGATVIGTASPRNHDYLRSLGALPVGYGDGLAERVRELAPDGVDAALDAAGTDEALRVSAALVADKNRAGSIAAGAQAKELGLQELGTRRSAERLARLVRHYQDGALRVTVDRVLTLAEAAKAHRELETGHVRGKIVLRV